MTKTSRLRPVAGVIIVISLLLLSPMSTEESRAQDGVAELLSLSVEEAGYGGVYRADQWTPLQITVTNRGDTFNGKVVVRPETSSAGLDHTFSAPIVDLSRPISPASETTETLFLYFVATSDDARLRVELLNAEDEVVTSQDVSLRDLRQRDSLYVTIPQSNQTDLNTASVGGYDSFQVAWSLDDIPDRAGGLEAVDAIVFSDVDTGQLAEPQRAALREWVQRGGHLIVTGGDNQAQTAAGLTDILPFTPDETQTITDLTPLARFAGQYERTLNGDTLITTGTVNDGARVLLADGDDRPLIVRHTLGGGTVDYLTISPNLAPLSNWEQSSDMWFSLLTSTQAQPSWTHGFSDWDAARTAVEILPGVDLLPSVLSLLAFLGVYVLLIGPLNYLVLARVNRLGYAWLTIPLFIVVFSVLAWSVGFELRGTTVTLSRLTVVQSWPDQDEAAADQLLGLLAPRRGNYTLALEDQRMLRPIGQGDTLQPLEGDTRNVEIQQFSQFEAVDFPVDASFIAGFATRGTVPSPAISGSVTTRVNEENEIALRGVVRNNSDITLTNPVVLARGAALTLDGSFEPGDIRDFQLNNAARTRAEAAVPYVQEFNRGGARISAVNMANRFTQSLDITERTTVEVLMRGMEQTGSTGVIVPTPEPTPFSPRSTDETDTAQGDEENRRREAFLTSFIEDRYGSTGRGNRAFLVGWATEADLPFEETVVGEQVETVDSVIYVVELATERADDGGTQVVTQDQFTWVSVQRDTAIDIGPVNLSSGLDSEVVFRFTPLPGAVLEDVDDMVMVLDRGGFTRTSGTIDLWNWQESSWETISYGRDERYSLPNFSRFLGPQNAVQVRVQPSAEGGISRIARLGFEQRGTF